MEKDLDIKLYNEYLDGNKEAFELLYNKYKEKIQYFIYNIVKDYQKAEDITQDNHTMADFRTAYDAFIKSPTTDNAKKLKNLYDDTKGKGAFKSYAKLYESHKKEIEDVLRKENA